MVSHPRDFLRLFGLVNDHTMSYWLAKVVFWKYERLAPPTEVFGGSIRPQEAIGVM